MIYFVSSANFSLVPECQWSGKSLFRSTPPLVYLVYDKISVSVPPLVYMGYDKISVRVPPLLYMGHDKISRVGLV